MTEQLARRGLSALVCALFLWNAALEVVAAPVLADRAIEGEASRVKAETAAGKVMPSAVADPAVRGEVSRVGAETACFAAGQVQEESILRDDAMSGTVLRAGGYLESLYAIVTQAEGSDVNGVSYINEATGEKKALTQEDLKYLVREGADGSVRIDIPGVPAGLWTLRVTVRGRFLEQNGITVSAHDRSGYAHFAYTEGVGAYNDDGSLKDGAVVLYVTDSNKNEVTLSVDGVSVTGIGNILNSAGKSTNGNQDILKHMARAGRPLAVRILGTVSDSGLYGRGSFDPSGEGLIQGLTGYSSTRHGGSVGDNGHMARMKSGRSITIEGIGPDATIDGWGFAFIADDGTVDEGCGRNFEVRNLTFINTPEDAVGMEGEQSADREDARLVGSVERCWIHNNSFYVPSILAPAEDDKGEGDGSVDFKRGQFFTCSYNYFEGCHKTHLVGANDTNLQFNLTYHHNHWFMCGSRGPLSRRANIHMYNNLVDMQTSYAQDTRAHAFIFSEYNLFYAVKNPQRVEGGAIKSCHDWFVSCQMDARPATVVPDRLTPVENDCCYIAEGIDYSSFELDSSLSYIPDRAYSLQEDVKSLRRVLAAYAGVMPAAPKLPGEIGPEDYSVVARADAAAGTGIRSLRSLPYEAAPGQMDGRVWAFETERGFDIEVMCNSVGAPSVLVDDAGEPLLVGSGSVTALRPGRYLLQSSHVSAWKYTDASSFVSFADFGLLRVKLTANSAADGADSDPEPVPVPVPVPIPPQEPAREGIMVLGLAERYSSTGAAIRPPIEVRDFDIGGEEGRLLLPGVDYTVSYKYNKNPGMAQIWLTGKGNYAGRDAGSVRFEIADAAVWEGEEAPVSLAGAKLDAIPAMAYTGDPLYPPIRLTLKGGLKREYRYDVEDGCYKTAADGRESEALRAGVSFSNNTAAGTATLLLTGAMNGAKRTVLRKTFKISAVSLKNNPSARVSVGEAAWRTAGARPAVTVSMGDVCLVEGRDYTLKYSGNKTAGKAGKVTVTGKGNYSGSLAAVFQIKPLSLGDLAVSAVSVRSGMKAGKVTALVLDPGGTAMSASRMRVEVYEAVEEDGAVVPGSMIPAAMALGVGRRILVRALAKDVVNLVPGSYCESGLISVGTALSGANAQLVKIGSRTKTWIYTGYEALLTGDDLQVRIKGRSAPLAEGEDYHFAGYAANTSAGTATAYLQGMGSYSGYRAVKFKIAGKTLAVNADG